MSEIADRYRRLSDHFAEVVAAVPADRWDAPTPCEEWTAIELVQHVVDSQSMFRGLVGREPVDGPPVAEDPGAAWRATAAAVQADLDDPALAAQTFEGFFGESTFEQAVDRFVNMDLVVHVWDLARATGGDERMAPEDVERIDASLAAFGEMLYSPGVCGPAVDVGPDADAPTKLLARLGRTA